MSTRNRGWVRELSARVVANPEFASCVMTATDRSSVELTLSRLLKEELTRVSGGGLSVRIYAPQTRGREQSEERARIIRAQFTGANVKDLARRHGISERQIRRIVTRAAA